MAHFDPILSPPVRLVRLTQEHDFKPFDCGNTDLNNFLIEDSKYNLKYLLSVTYVIENEDKTIAYFNVANDLLRISADSHKKFKSILRRKVKDKYLYKLFNYTEFPAVKIGRLAVNKDFQCRGIGTQLIKAITYSFINNNKTGCVFITVEALNNPRTINFYEKNGFNYLIEPDAKKESLVMFRCLLNYIQYPK